MHEAPRTNFLRDLAVEQVDEESVKLGVLVRCHLGERVADGLSLCCMQCTSAPVDVSAGAAPSSCMPEW
jgi:hypothetical protein